MKKKLTSVLLFLAMSVGVVSAQTSKVTGKVVGEDGEPVIGASIIVKGTTVGTVTDFDGNFTLDVPSDGKQLVISYIGMKSKEVVVSPNVNVTLMSDTQNLDEVVVTAMGISKEKKALGYAVQDVKSDELTQGANTSLSGALQGKVSGIDINRKMLAEMAVNDAAGFAALAEVAKKAVESIQHGETIMIESGSCCALVALEIAKTKKDVTLITNSAFIADYIRKHTAIKIILLGGEYQHESQVMVGPMMRKCAEAFFVDKLFIGTDGFSIDTGFTGNDYMRCEAVKDMARQASHVIIVTESDKFHQKGVSNLIDLHQVSCIYTDQGIPQEVEEYFKEKHIQVEKV